MQDVSSIPRLVLAGVSSGVGKTTVTVALSRALRARGLRVAAFKCGPDYLDPTYHGRATGTPSQNLDGWMMGSDAVRSTFLHAARGADIALIEGVMGLFDGESPTGEAGSTAEIAKWLGAPVVLVVDASGMARSVAAVLHGFATFDPELRVSGAVANRVGSKGHLALLRRALGERLYGGLPRDAAASFPERHLGLVTASRATLPESLLERWGETAAAWLDVERLVALARDAPALEAPSTLRAHDVTPARCRIGLAHDEAFHFYYADNLRRLEASGATLVRFSPIADATMPDVDGVYIGGGYPEVHAAALAANRSMRASLREFAGRGGPIYAECGGLMYLAEAIQTLDGQRHPMAGLIPATAVMRGELTALGYVETAIVSSTLLGPAGTRFRGHQFRYSELLLRPDSESSVGLAYFVRRRRDEQSIPEGYQVGNVLASYVHAHFASNPRIATELVDTCARFAKQLAGERPE